MRALPTITSNFDATTTPAGVYPMTEDTRRSLRAGIGKRIHGWYPSSKSGSLEYIGPGQADALPIFDLRPDVAAVAVCPVEVRFAVDGTAQSWIPDLGVRMTNGRQLVMDVLDLAEANFFAKTGLAQLVSRALADRGIIYQAHDHTALQGSLMCRNADYAQSFKSVAVEEQSAAYIEDYLTVRDRVTLGDLKRGLPHCRAVVARACALAWAGRLVLELASGPQLEMVVRLGSWNGRR